VAQRSSGEPPADLASDHLRRDQGRRKQPPFEVADQLDERLAYPSAPPLAIAWPAHGLLQGEFSRDPMEKGSSVSRQQAAVKGGSEGRSAPLRAATNRERFRSLCSRTTIAANGGLRPHAPAAAG
jgi:hypothetical protein